MRKSAIATAVLCSMASFEIAGDRHETQQGPDRGLAAGNHIKIENVLVASKLVKTGNTCNLGIVVISETPEFAQWVLHSGEHGYARVG